MYQVARREGDPFIYLNPGNRWYYYDPTSKPLGAGSMGTVYLGYAMDTRERIAVKRVNDMFSNNVEIRRRAMNEANLVFFHPNIVRMLGVCTEAQNYGPIFILSEFVDGLTFEDYARQNLTFLPEDARLSKIVEMAIPLLDALQVLHDNKIVHRDIKPSNIMVQKDGTVKLMDLGIAKVSDSGTGHKTIGFIGTTQYAAPELLVGDNEVSKSDYRVDIYAFGVTLYELMTGNNPFDAPTQVEVMMKQLRSPLPHTATIPSALFSMLRKATEKRREDRYQSALEMKNDLVDYLQARNGTGSKLRISRTGHNRKPLLIAMCLLAVLTVFQVVGLVLIYNSL